MALPAGWGLAAAINQWLLYGAALLAVGSALCGLWGPMAPAAKGLAGVIGRRASGFAAILYILAVGMVGADLLGVPGQGSGEAARRGHPACAQRWPARLPGAVRCL